MPPDTQGQKTVQGHRHPGVGPRGLDTEHGSSCRPRVAERACSCPGQCVFPRTGRGRPAPGAAVCGPLDSTLSSRITLTMTKTSIFHLLFDEMWDVIVPKIAQLSDWTGKEPRVEGQILSHHSRCWPRPQEQPHLSKRLPRALPGPEAVLSHQGRRVSTRARVFEAPSVHAQRPVPQLHGPFPSHDLPTPRTHPCPWRVRCSRPWERRQVPTLRMSSSQ